MQKSYNPNSLTKWWDSMQKADAREWMRVSAEVGEYVRELSGREDAIAVMEPNAADGNLAVWIPERAELRVDTDKCAEGIAPADVDFSTAVGRLKHPALTGGCVHEGAHALASKWALDQSPKKRQVVQAALLLEEARAEKAMIAAHPDVRMFLRAGFFGLVRGSDDPTDIRGAAHLAALGMARVDAGILHADEMQPVKELLVGILTEELYDGLRSVWLKAHKVGDHDQATMEALGQEWLDLLPEEAKDDGEGVMFIVCGGGDGSDGEGGESGSLMEKIAKAIAEDAEDEAEGKVDAAKASDAHSARKKEASEARAAEREAKAVFVSHGHGTGSREGVDGWTAPTVKVRQTANVLARAIERAQHRARTKTVVSSKVPPGRLRGAAAVRRSAQRAQGIPVTAEPWKQTIRRHVENPPITCGIMMDVSGSMRWAEKPVAEASWAIAHAIHRNEGDSATVAYGNHVHAVVKPGENPRQMPILNAGGGSEVPTQAVLALDGALNLTHGEGVRLLVNISDGVYTSNQRESYRKQLTRLINAGVIVLWLDMDARGSDPINLKGVEVVKVARGESNVGQVVGAAITKALSAA